MSKDNQIATQAATIDRLRREWLAMKRRVQMLERQHDADQARISDLEAMASHRIDADAVFRGAGGTSRGFMTAGGADCLVPLSEPENEVRA